MSKREAHLIYTITGKRAEKGCHLRDLLFPDSNALACIGTLHIYQEEVLARGYKTTQDRISPSANICLQLLKNKARAMSKHCSALATPLPLLPSTNVPECPMGSMPKKMAFPLTKISVYGNRGRAVS